jgi:hypothetical protein
MHTGRDIARMFLVALSITASKGDSPDTMLSRMSPQIVTQGRIDSSYNRVNLTPTHTVRLCRKDKERSEVRRLEIPRVGSVCS